MIVEYAYEPIGLNCCWSVFKHGFILNLYKTTFKNWPKCFIRSVCFELIHVVHCHVCENNDQRVFKKLWVHSNKFSTVFAEPWQVSKLSFYTRHQQQIEQTVSCTPSLCALNLLFQLFGCTFWCISCFAPIREAFLLSHAAGTVGGLNRTAWDESNGKP